MIKLNIAGHKVAGYLCVLFFVLTAGTSLAAIKLPGLIGNNMILQRSAVVPVWGWAKPGEEIKVKFIGKTYKAFANNTDGKWMVKLNTAETGGPAEMQIKGKGEKIALKNILLGDVWLCAGQSNMVFDFNNDRAKVLYAADMAASLNSQIRQVLVNRGYASSPAADCKTTGWRMASPQTINSFSAVAYFFALNLFNQYHVPIGIINSSLGGTIAEAWTSEQGLKDMPRFEKDIRFLQDTVALINRLKDDLRKIVDWDKEVQQRDTGYNAAGSATWAAPDLVDDKWHTISKLGAWGKNGYSKMFGAVWFRKEINVPEDAVGNNGVLSLGQLSDADFTYFNGQIIGKTNNRDYKRQYQVPAQLIKAGKNIITIRVINYNDPDGFAVDESIRFSVNNTVIPLNTAWKFSQGIKLEVRPKALEPKNLPTSLYNAMIAPLVPYAIKGVVWYQGEYNAHQAFIYRQLFQSLIKDWRKQWHQGDFPFVYEQLPNFQPVYDHPIGSEWAELREAQTMALKQPNTGMAVAIDLGEANEIHPVDKKDVGYRLSLVARKLAYNEPSLVASGPVYKSMKVEEGKIILTFDTNISPIVSRDEKSLRFFAIAGADKKFVWANAVIKNNEIEVSSPMVPQPVAVRYGWAGNPEGCNLFNEAGLPASPFRTDDWPGMTIDN